MYRQGIGQKIFGTARLLLVALAVFLGMGMAPAGAMAQPSGLPSAAAQELQEPQVAAAADPLDSFNVTATVSLSGGSLKAGEFTFRLTDPSGTVVRTTNQHSSFTGLNNYVNFEIPYGQVGTRTYQLSQESNPRYRCDARVYQVRVTVTQDMLGNKGASVDYSVDGTAVSEATFSNGLLPAPTGQWVHEGGVTRYRTPEGTYASGWTTIDGQTYYFDPSGSHGRRTGWLQQGGSWYFLSPADGHRETGWIRTGGVWYYLNPANGAMATGWLELGSTWYYLTGSGAMATGWVWVNGAWYYLTGSGAMATGWVFTGGHWYYLTGSGAMAIGWIWTGGAWYYLAPGDGHMYRGWGFINGSWYFFDRSSGVMKTGWLWDGAWYYLYSSGAMAHNTSIGAYRLNSSGAWV